MKVLEFSTKMQMIKILKSPGGGRNPNLLEKDDSIFDNKLKAR